MNKYLDKGDRALLRERYYMFCFSTNQHELPFFYHNWCYTHTIGIKIQRISRHVSVPIKLVFFLVRMPLVVEIPIYTYVYIPYQRRDYEIVIFKLGKDTYSSRNVGDYNLVQGWICESISLVSLLRGDNREIIAHKTLNKRVVNQSNRYILPEFLIPCRWTCLLSGISGPFLESLNSK